MKAPAPGRLIPRRLGAKLAVFLLVFGLILGAAIATVMATGLRRTQDDATARSRQGLEIEGIARLKTYGGLQSGYGQAQFGAVAELGRQAARYIAALPPQPAGTVQVDGRGRFRLTRSSSRHAASSTIPTPRARPTSSSPRTRQSTMP
jgi:hypothetical protein